MIDPHRTTTDRSDTFFGSAWTARCTCGWVGPTVTADDHPDTDDPDVTALSAAAAHGTAHAVVKAAEWAKTVEAAEHGHIRRRSYRR